MVIIKFIAVVYALLWCETATALPFDHLDDQVNAAIDAGTFQNPSANIRPKFRYWLPDASIDVDNLAADFASIASLGAGTVELLNYWLYGGIAVTQPVVPVDWDIFNFGTPIYNTVLKAALQACKDNGLLMDFEVGVQSGQGAPAEPDNPGLAWFLNSSLAIIAPGQTFSGTVPGFGMGNLVAVSTGAITAEGVLAGAQSPLFTVTESSLQDITSNVTANGTLTITFPEDSGVEEYFIYASYALQPLVRAGLGGPDPQNFIQNGSFAVDHFSATGATVTTDFLEQFVLINGAKELMQEVGNYIWEDSIEIQGPGIYWTPNFTVAFEAQHNYSILPFLPLLSFDNGNGISSSNFFAFELSGADNGSSYVNDFRQTLTNLYGTYVQHWTNWSNTFLNLQSSAQIGYNLPVDIRTNMPLINAPEGETLAFANLVDAFRQISGAANIAGKRVLSVELGADPTFVYSLPVPTLLENAKRAISGGVNTFVLHGSPYSYSYPNTTWPGYTSFAYEFSEQYQRHQPAWENGYSEALDWLARSSFILQAGIPKIDVALWTKLNLPYSTAFPLYDSSDLVDAGLAYEYLSPDLFALPQAVVTNNTLAAEGPAYKALVIRNNDTLTVDGVAALAEFANAGLQIIVAGGFPAFFSPQNATAAAFVNTTLASISTLPNVHIVADAPVASAILAAGIVPRAQVNSNGTLWTVWRTTNTSDNVFIFSDGSDTVGSIKFASTATPYFFDAWTGEQVAVLNYTVDTTSQTTEIAFSLKADQTVIVSFSNESISGVEVPPIHFTSVPDETVGFSFSNTTGLTAKIAASASTSNTTQVLVTSDGQQHTVDTSSVPAAFELPNWNLTAEHWDPPSNLSDIDIIAVKTNTTHTNLTYPLLDWNSIPGLANTSGLGFYSTSFTWPPASTSTPTTNTSSLGALLTFTSPVLQTLHLTINSIDVPPIDPTNPTVDITPFLLSGSNATNVVEAKIATIMYNVLVPILEELRTAASGLGLPRDEYPAFREVGLVGGVVVTPFLGVSVGV